MPYAGKKKPGAPTLGVKSWPVHRPDLDMEKIVEMTKLQLWTLKPAHRK